MNVEQTNRSSAAGVGIIIGSVIFAALTVGLIFAIQAPSVDVARATERSKALAEIHATEEKALTTAAVIDAQRGIVRLPIDTAMSLAAKQWANPTAARANLKDRVEKATAPVKQESFE